MSTRDSGPVDVLSVRRAIFRHYAATGAPPTLPAEDLAALAAEHAVVLDGTGAIAFANPFATGPAACCVRTDRRVHHAVCAWDALGILAALGCDGTVETGCPDCTERIVVRVRAGSLEPARAVVHFLLPAAHWYDDLGFT